MRDIDAPPGTSAVVEVEILSTEPLEPMFQAVGGWCFGGQCFAEAGLMIDFSDETTGSPTFYEYDWDRENCSEEPEVFDESSSRPSPSTFTRSGTFCPTLEVTRGGEWETYVLPTFYVTGIFDDGFESGDLSKWSEVLP